MLTVACVLNVGEDMDRPYSPDWVTRLRGMVTPSLSIPHRFVCLSNVAVPGVDTIPLENAWPRWWAKIELFKHDFGARALALDLDLLVTGSLDDVANFPAPLVFGPPHHKIMGIPPKPKAGVVRRYQSSIIAWSPPQGRVIYETFCKDPDRIMWNFRGDQDFIGWLKPHCPTLPVAWVRKLRQCKNGPPPDCRIVLSQWPMLNDTAAEKMPWVRELWCEQTEPRLPQ